MKQGAQSEAPSVDIRTILLKLAKEIERNAGDYSDVAILDTVIESEAKINRLIVQGRLERGIYELERLEHDPQMFGDWEKVVEERIHLLETELSALSNNLSKERQ